jgi:hypothetical protein
MNKKLSLVTAALILTAPAAFAEEDCVKIAFEVRNAAKDFPDKILENVAEYVSESPKCACEVVKAAIEATSASEDLVAAIVETAIVASPEQMRIIAQCAVAVAPDALPKVQAVLAKLDVNSGEAASAKSAKGEKAAAQEVASMGNPLDFPGKGPVGPLPIFPGPPGFFIPPDPIDPDLNTLTDPQLN